MRPRITARKLTISALGFVTGAALTLAADRELKRLAQAQTPPAIKQSIQDSIEPDQSVHAPAPTRAPATPAKHLSHRDRPKIDKNEVAVKPAKREIVQSFPVEEGTTAPARTEPPTSPPVVVEARLPQPPPVPTVPLSRCVPVESDADLALLYFTVSGKVPEAADWEWLAGRFSSDYYMTQDAFKKQERLAVLKAKFESLMRQFQHRCFVVTNTVYLGHYDTAKGSFPLHPQGPVPQLWSAEAPWTYIQGTQPVKLSVSNMSAFTHYALADGPEARRIEAMLPVQRTGKAKAYLFAQAVSGGTIKSHLLHVELFDYNGNPLGAFGLRN